uniref:Putative cobalt transport protein n=1 Tax=Paulinella micropora TaxID=1928728 RepID=A0A385HZM2_9EUKA|nr:putative cobalt transport protein [Paulinella micropora]AXY63085.1 putative cobalt transport protein [Paulinella micropora]
MDWLRQLPIGQFIVGSSSWIRYLDPRLKLAWTIIFLTSPISAGPIWRISLMAFLLIITIISGLRWRSWYYSVSTLLLTAIVAGLLTTLLPSTMVPPTGSVRPYNELTYESYFIEKDILSEKFLLIRWGLTDWDPPNNHLLVPNALIMTRLSISLGVNTTTFLFTLLHSTNLLLLSTPPEELIWALNWFLMPLRIIGVPTEKLGFMLLLALRFIPLVEEEIQNLLRSVSTRAINPKQLGVQGSLNLILAINERLLINILLRAEQGAEALIARGSHWLSPIYFKPNIRVITIINIICLFLMVVVLCIRGKYGMF